MSCESGIYFSRRLGQEDEAEDEGDVVVRSTCFVNEIFFLFFKYYILLSEMINQKQEK